ncbi:tRNA (adenine(58)-N(1))-methyltransferase catalytic subunit trm61 [Cytospora mali]|uniref:tRNA (adenine(58)-N(1))-methyltransferase catalytic subunit TRM61 n=1 Tax=Cytospora mali TaxID=578113 RepID=A0A194V8T0_CYTMA|nr:tRNA (adenine(58)-N(1))-methyltransferase catalytic subunit trm61 [Valsa mali var. pyri (nom. inval.)]
MLRQDSPFLNPGPATKADTLAIIQLSKDDLVPVYLRDTKGEHDGYKEGHVLNTRFGSFPHSTLIGIPWGSQVRASNVDTGSRGRKKKNNKEVKEGQAPDEEKANNDGGEDASEPAQKQQKTTTAKTGFVYILPPTPEIWTSSLPHRTQVVYTPDYSYVLQRIRARPGSRLIEAGSGSGSFTHASVRAVYDGCTGYHDEPKSTGKVFSFEFHEQRFEKMKKEISEHGLDRLVEINHRDVYKDGFLVDGKSPEADAIFLDLPAPWQALPHLSRRRPKTASDMEGIQTENGEENWVSPLNPRKSAYICTFSPCIEQVTRTVSEMRKLGWVEIEMVEIAHKRINVFREKIGMNIVSDRGCQQAPKDVAEAMAKLKEIEAKAAEHNAKMFGGQNKKDVDVDMEDDDAPAQPKANGEKQAEKSEALAEESKEASAKPFLQGRLVTRPETELKTHTSYLVFAILPREWTEEDEAAAAAKWPIGEESQKVIGAMDRASRKQERRELLQGTRKKNKNPKEKHQPREKQPKIDLTTEQAKSQAQEVEAEMIIEDVKS